MFLLLMLVRNPYAFMKSIIYLLSLRSFSAYLGTHHAMVQEAIDHGLAEVPRADQVGKHGGLAYAYALPTQSLGSGFIWRDGRLR